MAEIADVNPQLFIQYHNGIGKYKQIQDKVARSKFRKVETFILSGPSGCGKTRYAMEHATYKIQGSALQWWDGYDGEKIILIDEYANDVKITQLLAILDGYQLRLPIKGGFTYANWHTVYITTNLTKKELHSQALPAHQNALNRRIKKWLKVPNRGNTGPLLDVEEEERVFFDEAILYDMCESDPEDRSGDLGPPPTG